MKNRFKIVLVTEGRAELNWWMRVVEDYEVNATASSRPEYPNMRDYLDDTGGLAPFTVEIVEDCVIITDAETTRSNAVAAGIVVMQYLRAFKKDWQVLFSYATLPDNDEQPGSCGGGVVEVRQTFVGTTTTDDLIRESRRKPIVT